MKTETEEQLNLLNHEQYECWYRLRYEEKSILPIVRLNAATVLKSTYVGRPFHVLINTLTEKGTADTSTLFFKQFVTMSPDVYSRAETNTVTNITLNIPKDNLITPCKISNKAT